MHHIRRLGGEFQCHWPRTSILLKLSLMSETSSTVTSADPRQLQAEIDSLRLQLEEARDEAELNLLQLQQVQEELEFYFLAHQQQDQLLQGHREQAARAGALIEALLERLEQRR